MSYLFEKADSLNTPIECFIFDASKENFPVRPHWHYFCEVIYILEGCANMQYNDTLYSLQKGDMILFHPRTIHSITADNAGSLKYVVLKFDINKFNISSPYAPKLRTIFKQAEQQQMNVFFDAKQAMQLNVPFLFQNCLSEIQERHYGYDLMLQNHIYSLLMNIVRHWLTCGFVIQMDTAESDYDIDSITEYIDACMGKNYVFPILPPNAI